MFILIKIFKQILIIMLRVLAKKLHFFTPKIAFFTKKKHIFLFIFLKKYIKYKNFTILVFNDLNILN